MESYKQELTQIKEILQNNPKGMTVTDIARAVNINRNSVAKYLDILLASGQAEMITFGPAKVFFPSRRVPLIHLLNYISDYVVILDEYLRVQQINDVFLDLLDLPKEEIVGGRIENAILERMNITGLLSSINEALKGKEYRCDLESKIDDDVYYFHVHLIPTICEDGKHSVACILTDISEKRKIELALQKKKKTTKNTSK
ncbi:MAG: PAS domain-containing protein [Candidatus Thermoplasmatota archaeon]